MDQLQRQFRQQLQRIKQMKVNHITKIYLIENIIEQLKQLQNINRTYQTQKSRTNYQVLSTSISQCQSINYQNEKDIEQLEQKILKMRMVKFQNNQDIETIEEELFQIQKIVKARAQFNDYMKKQIDSKMLSIQQQNDKTNIKKQEKSVLNKSLDAVTNVFKGKWWG